MADSYLDEETLARMAAGEMVGRFRKPGRVERSREDHKFFKRFSGREALVRRLTLKCLKSKRSLKVCERVLFRIYSNPDLKDLHREVVKLSGDTVLAQGINGDCIERSA